MVNGKYIIHDRPGLGFRVGQVVFLLQRVKGHGRSLVKAVLHTVKSSMMLQGPQSYCQETRVRGCFVLKGVF